MTDIKKCLMDLNNIVIINVTRDYFYNLNLESDNDSYYFMPSELKGELILNEPHVKSIFDKLCEIAKFYSNKLIIIAFEEYFFSEYIALDLEEFNIISNACKNFTLNYKNCILFINLLHQIDIKEKKDIENNIQIYSNIIGSKIVGKNFWKVTSISNLLPKGHNIFFRNCTYVYMLGKILYNQKKSTYSNEVKFPGKYDIGFFEMKEINHDLT